MPADISLLREWIKGLRFGPLEPTDSRYVPLADGGRGAVDSIFSLITLEARPTTQLLSGPRGSGKTTELLRLKRDLEDAGYTTVVVDMLAYVSQSSPIHAVEALLALGVAFGDHLAPDEPEAEGGFASRFRRFLQRVNVTIDIGPASVHASGEGAGVTVPGLSMDIDVKKEVRHSEPFVQLLRARLAFHLGELYQEVSSFCRELVDQDLARRPESKGVVLIVDSLEKLRDVSSVRDLFVLDSDKLSFPSHHVVYTVPPVLQFTAPGSLPFDGPVRSVPVPHVRDRDGGRFEPASTSCARSSPGGSAGSSCWATRPCWTRSSWPRAATWETCSAAWRRS